MNDTDVQTIKTTETTFKIIGSLQDHQGAKLSDIAHELEISKSTVRNHLMTLRKHGYVVVDDNGIYRLSLEFFDLGERVRNEVSLYKSAIPVINNLAQKTNEKAQVMVEQGGVGYYIYREKGRQGVNTRDGRRAELHCTSAGKAILAFMDRETAEHIIDKHGLPARTDQTITDRDQFIETLDDIREQGFAFNNEERLNGLRAVGAPVLHDNTLLGAISISGPTTRVRGERYREELPKLVKQSADVANIRTQYL